MDRERRPVRAVLVAVVLVLVLTGVGAIAGLVAGVVRGPTFTSTSQLLWDPSVRAQFDPSYNTPDSQGFDRQVADQQDVVLSDAVTGRVAQAVDEPVAEVRDEVTVTSTAGSAVFSIAAAAPTAARARDVARATTSAYIAALRTQNEAMLQTRVTALTAQAAEVRRQLSSASTVAQASLATSLADLQTQLAAARSGLAAVPVEAQVQRAAATPLSPSSLSVPVQTVVGGALGAVLAICLLLLLNAIGPVLRRSRAGQRPPDRARVASAGAAAAPAVAGTASSSAAVERGVPAESSDAGHVEEGDADRRTPLTTGSIPYFD